MIGVYIYIYTCTYISIYIYICLRSCSIPQASGSRVLYMYMLYWASGSRLPRVEDRLMEPFQHQKAAPRDKLLFPVRSDTLAYRVVKSSMVSCWGFTSPCAGASSPAAFRYGRRGTHRFRLGPIIVDTPYIWESLQVLPSQSPERPRALSSPMPCRVYRDLSLS